MLLNNSIVAGWGFCLLYEAYRVIRGGFRILTTQTRNVSLQESPNNAQLGGVEEGRAQPPKNGAPHCCSYFCWRLENTNRSPDRFLFSNANDGFGTFRVSQDEDYLGFKCTLDNFIVHSSKGSLFIWPIDQHQRCSFVSAIRNLCLCPKFLILLIFLTLSPYFSTRLL